VTRSRLENALVGEGSVIVDSDITNSVIGIRSFIDRGARINRTVFMGADYFRWEESEARVGVQGPTFPGVGQDTRIENAIVDKNASIGNRCVITNEKGIQEGSGSGFYIRDGIIVIPKNADIPEGTVI
jgi:glucose-1-phosphate adenylyltransferase